MIDRYRLRLTVSGLPVRLGIAGATAILIVLSTRLFAAPIEVAYPAHTPTSVAAYSESSLARSQCWVTGDIVGDANPVQVHATLCGVSGSPRRAETRP